MLHLCFMAFLQHKILIEAVSCVFRLTLYRKSVEGALKLIWVKLMSDPKIQDIKERKRHNFCDLDDLNSV